MQNSIIGLRLPPDLKREFAEIASQQNNTMSLLTRQLIRNFVKKHRKNSHASTNH